MRSYLILLSLMLNIGLAESGRADDSKNYNLAPATIEQRSQWSKFDLAMDIASAMQEIGNMDTHRLCFRLGSVFTSTLIESVRYGMNANDPKEKEAARETFIDSLSVGTFCGFTKEDIVNPEFAETVLRSGTSKGAVSITTSNNVAEVLVILDRMVKRINSNASRALIAARRTYPRPFRSVQSLPLRKSARRGYQQFPVRRA